MTRSEDVDREQFLEAVQGLLRGDFSHLAPVFEDDSSNSCAILRWHANGWFNDQQPALEEALTCACFLGRTSVVLRLLADGMDVSAGRRTGLNGFHWAVNRGQLDTVKLLIEQKAPLEERNMYGGTILSTAVWSAIHEPRPDHLAIVEALLKAGAKHESFECPTGNAQIDALMAR